MRLIILTVLFTFIIGVKCHLGIIDVIAGTGSRIHGKIHDGLHTVASAVTGGLNGGLHFEFGGHVGANHHHGTETEVINVHVPVDQPDSPRYPEYGQNYGHGYNQNHHNQGPPQNYQQNQGHGHNMNFQHQHNQGQMQYDQHNYGRPNQSPQNNDHFHNTNEPNPCNCDNNNGYGGHDVNSQDQYNHHQDQNNYETPITERPHHLPRPNEQQPTSKPITEENPHGYGEPEASQDQNNHGRPHFPQDNVPESSPKPINNGENNINFNKPAPNKATTKKPDSDDNPLFIPLNHYDTDKKESNSPKRDTKTEAEKDDEFNIDIRFKDE